jgi:hypothetical protein
LLKQVDNELDFSMLFAKLAHYFINVFLLLGAYMLFLRKMFCLILLPLFLTSLNAMDKSSEVQTNVLPPRINVNTDKSLAVKTIDDIPGMCTTLARYLAQAPIISSVGSLNKAPKLICLNDWRTRLICETLNNAARRIREDAWPIYDFGGWENERFIFDGITKDILLKLDRDSESVFGWRKICRDHRIWGLTVIGKMKEEDIGKVGIELGIDIGFGLELRTSHEPLCSLQDLHQAYVDIIENLKKGWKAVDAKNKDYINILDAPKKKGEWRLFIKTKKFVDDGILIRVLASTFGIQDLYCGDRFIICNNAWLKPNGGFEDTDIMYLWIKKDKFDEVQKIFGFPKSCVKP